MGQPFLSVIHPDDVAASGAALEELARGQRTHGLVNRFHCKDGSYRHVAWTAISTPEGLVYAVARDITEQGQADEQQDDRSLDRDQAVLLAHKMESLAAMCHDLQQPLTVLLAQTQIIQHQLARGQALTDDELRIGMGHIFMAATRMRGMTQDLVDASLRDAGRPPTLLLARTELVALVRQVVEQHQLVSAAHQFLFEPEVPVLDATIDGPRLRRVLDSLLSNAFKYSPNGGSVHVAVEEGSDAEGKFALLVVRDEGVGIPAQDLPHVFDRFQRGTNVVGRFAGSGLGLASARELVELHGGTISVVSEEGKGSTFLIRLPLVPPTLAADPVDTHGQLRDKEPSRGLRA